jgi:hypothetical protein
MMSQSFAVASVSRRAGGSPLIVPLLQLRSHRFAHRGEESRGVDIFRIKLHPTHDDLLIIQDVVDEPAQVGGRGAQLSKVVLLFLIQIGEFEKLQEAED